MCLRVPTVCICVCARVCVWDYVPELRVGRAAGPHKAKGLGFTTSFSQIALVMDGHNSVAGCCLHIWFQEERKSNKTRKESGARGGRGERSRAARGWSIFSTMESSGANIRYITAACAPTNPHFPLRWLSRRLCCRCASSLVTLIGFSHERERWSSSFNTIRQENLVLFRNFSPHIIESSLHAG